MGSQLAVIASAAIATLFIHGRSHAAEDDRFARTLSLGGTFGVGTPVSALGVTASIAPIRQLAFEAGAGVGTRFGRISFGQMVRFRFPPSDDLSLGIGLSEVTGTDAEASDEVTLRAPGATHPPIAWFGNMEVAYESRGEAAFGRIALGLLVLLNRSAYSTNCDRAGTGRNNCVESQNGLLRPLVLTPAGATAGDMITLYLRFDLGGWFRI
jgi:hypothetical protein